MFFRNLIPVRASSFRFPGQNRLGKSKSEFKSLRSAKILKKAKADRDTRLVTEQQAVEPERKETISISEWQRKLGETVPLSMVPDILNVNPGFVAMAVREGRLPVHTFKTSDGKTYRVVKVNILKALAKISRDPQNLWEISLYYGLMQKDAEQTGQTSGRTEDEQSKAA